MGAWDSHAPPSYHVQQHQTKEVGPIRACVQLIEELKCFLAVVDQYEGVHL
jgi:hypothetical protein